MEGRLDVVGSYGGGREIVVVGADQVVKWIKDDDEGYGRGMGGDDSGCPREELERARWWWGNLKWKGLPGIGARVWRSSSRS